MLNAMIVGLLAASAGSAEITCPANDPRQDYHLGSVCAVPSEEAPAYSATLMIDMAPPPASQQVMMYRSGDQWLLRIAGYRWIPEGGAATRRREIAILDADAEELASRITEADLNQLSQLPFYGPNALFCLHGTTLAVSIGVAGKMSSATQHSCAGKTKLNQLAAAFRQLALKYDPEFEGLLSGLLE